MPSQVLYVGILCDRWVVAHCNRLVQPEVLPLACSCSAAEALATARALYPAALVAVRMLEAA